MKIWTKPRGEYLELYIATATHKWREAAFAKEHELPIWERLLKAREGDIEGACLEHNWDCLGSKLDTILIAIHKQVRKESIGIEADRAAYTAAINQRGG